MRRRLTALTTRLRLGFAPEPQLGPLYAYKRDAFTAMLGALYCWEALRTRPTPIDQQDRYELDAQISTARSRFQSKLMLAAVVADHPAPFDREPEAYTYRRTLDLCRKDLKLR